MKVAIYSLGCKVNIYESEYVTSLLKKAGYEIVDFNTKADIYIINTCSVTNESDRKSRKIIREAKRNNPGSIIIVMGCYSQVKYDEIEADIIIGNKDKSRIVDIISEYLQNHEPIKRIYDLKNQPFEPMEITSFASHTRAFVKIQDGCNAFCSYCIIPYTRGNIRSKKEEDVIKEITNLVNKGYKEIILTGIHTGKYGVGEKTNLETLLKKIVKIPNLYRVRLSSIEINEVTDGILDLMKNNTILARHLHIPLQSGSDQILKLMNRHYNIEYFMKRIREIRTICPDIAITTDLIVGFPGETEEDFQETMDTLKKINFMHIHTFPYSKRDKTKAATMLNQIDGNTKKKRVHEVITLSHTLENAFYQKYIGQTLEGVTELRKDGVIMVHTSNYIPVIINDRISNNVIVKVKIESVNDNLCYGVVINSKEKVVTSN